MMIFLLFSREEKENQKLNFNCIFFFTAKIPKPPQSHRAGVSVLNAQGRQQNLAAVRGALSQFNQQGARMQGKMT